MSVGPNKAGRPTGPGDGGFLVTDQDLPRGVLFEFVLTNFNIDGNMLKPEHRALLDEHVIPFLKANKVHAEIIGTTSQTGSAAYDKELSRERAFRVRDYLVRHGLPDPKVPAQDVRAAGKTLSHSKNIEDPLDRAVRVRIVVGVRKVSVLPRVVVPQIAPPQAPVVVLNETIVFVDNRTPWAIQELTGFNVGIGASIGAALVQAGVQAGTVEYHFLLVNSRTRQMAQCRYFGPAASGGVGPGGLKPGVSVGPGFSMTQGSHKWDQFLTSSTTGFDDFAGAATWAEAGAGGGSTISNCRLILHKLGLVVDVTTGATIGTPGTLISTGNFFLKPPLQLQP